MKKYFFIIFAIFSAFTQKVFAEEATSTTKEDPLKTSNVLGVPDAHLRTGNVSIDTIPVVIANVTNTIIVLSGTISAFMLIYFAFRMQLASGITGDSSGVESARKGMIASGVGFIISISAWFIMGRVIDILTTVS